MDTVYRSLWPRIELSELTSDMRTVQSIQMVGEVRLQCTAFNGEGSDDSTLHSVIDGQVIDNSLLLLYYTILFSLDYSHQFNLCH